MGDAYERHADAVADGVVRGASVESLLGPAAARAVTAPHVQRAGGDEAAYGEEGSAETLYPNDAVKQRSERLLAHLRKIDEGKRGDKGGSGRGYMVGVAQCVDGTFVAAASGDHRDDFTKAVSTLDMQCALRIPVSDGVRKIGSFDPTDKPRPYPIHKGEKSHGDCAAPKIRAWAHEQRRSKTQVRHEQVRGVARGDVTGRALVVEVRHARIQEHRRHQRARRH